MMPLHLLRLAGWGCALCACVAAIYLAAGAALQRPEVLRIDGATAASGEHADYSADRHLAARAPLNPRIISAIVADGASRDSASDDSSGEGGAASPDRTPVSTRTPRVASSTPAAEPTDDPSTRPTVTNTTEPKPTKTREPEPTATSTPEPKPTDTPEPTDTPSPRPTKTPDPTDTPKPTATPRKCRTPELGNLQHESGAQGSKNGKSRRCPTPTPTPESKAEEQSAIRRLVVAA